MNESSYYEILKDQTKRSLWNLMNVMECIPDAMWDKEYCEMPLWKHVYHMLHSADMWFVNPGRYTEPDFHVKDLNNLDVRSDTILTKEQLMKYRINIETKISAYLEELNDRMLLGKPEDCQRTRATLIIGQLRHLDLHLGMLMGYIISETGLWPRVIGLQNDIPAGDYDPFY